MIDCFNIKTCHGFPGNILASQFRLRYKLNIERQKWNVPAWGGEFEYDAYDNPSTVYFVWRDEANVVRACQRLYPTELPVDTRKRITNELALAGLEFALGYGIKAIVGVMQPAYWKSVYINTGNKVTWLGETTKLDSGYKVRAGSAEVSSEVIDKVRHITNIHETILNYGDAHEII